MSNDLPLFIAYLANVAAVTFVQLFTLFGPGLILVTLLSQVSAYVERQASLALGRGTYVLLFGGIGTLVHELSHALVALLFGFSILGFKGLPSNPHDPVQGYVISGTANMTLWKMIGFFFIGIAPIVFGTLFLFAALLILFDPELLRFLADLGDMGGLAGPARATPGLADFVARTLAECLALLAFIFQPAHWADWRLYAFLYLAFAVGSSINLSAPDIEHALAGFLALVALWFGFNLATLWMSGLDAHSLEGIGQTYAWFYGILAVVIVLNLLAALVLLLPATLRTPKAH